MYVKTLLQEVWRSKTEWDEEISPVLSSKWRQWIDVLPSVQHIKIPRCYLQVFSDYNNTDINLHTFVDASKDGYAAVCYLRLFKGNKVTCSLVGSSKDNIGASIGINGCIDRSSLLKIYLR